MSKEILLAKHNYKSTVQGIIGGVASRVIGKPFVDYEYFSDADKNRAPAKQAFLGGKDYVPEYDYPKLDEVAYPGKKMRTRIHALQEAELELTALSEKVDLTAEQKLWQGYIDCELKKIRLVQSAAQMENPDTIGSSSETARETWNQLNGELFGEMDVKAYRAMISTEYRRARDFQPRNATEEQMKNELLLALEPLYSPDTKEEPLLSDEKMRELHETIMKRYEKVLAVVPDTDETKKYDADACAKIINDALAAAELAEKGWKCEVSKTYSIPSTSAERKTIFLPKGTSRTADELRRLIVHEVEVHARRGQNGAESGVVPLEKGTANYGDVEEGAGVLLECAVAGTLDNPSFHRARDRYLAAGLALRTGEQPPRDANQVQYVLSRILALRNAESGAPEENLLKNAEKASLVHLENEFRGTPFYARGIVYRKLKVYWEGLAKNAQILNEATNLNEALDQIMIGKYNHTDSNEIKLVKEAIKEKQNT